MRKLVIAIALLSAPTLALPHGAREGQGTLVVQSVVPDGAAAAAGVRVGDDVVGVAGRKIENLDDLNGVVAEHRPGDSVALVVLRDGERVDLTLTFGERPDGGASIGVSLQVPAGPGDGSAEPTRGTTECLAWIDRTYRVESIGGELGLALSDDLEVLRACVARDTQRMTSDDAIKYCDNVFKIHCSANDLLGQIAEAQVARCEKLLDQSLGLDPRQHKAWTTCGQSKVYDRYVMAGEPSDANACRATLQDECGTNIDASIAGAELSAEQRDFAACCSADALAKQVACPMIDERFSRGPCLDRSVCLNRITSEWLSCPARE